ncbi:hypothetical protein SPSIL_052200 [Sporomusa silvacetica DSM 10669]|uniref:Uncharacterized protein n=1 Tax=Sporomusa silvacetica DSM 10669 TaxID=1123289 RepID=A0ABZ3ITI8_9FIRM|nr:hypothetical protein SPSIL_06320 [Sporomusa silvacetica DSM 10669]
MLTCKIISKLTNILLYVSYSIEKTVEKNKKFKYNKLRILIIFQ